MILTASLFLMMVVAGGASAYISYLMGEEALKVVTQPDVSSGENPQKDKIIGTHKGLKLISEREILVNIYNLTRGKKKSANQVKELRKEQSEQLINLDRQSEQNNHAFFPIRDEAEGVSMEVVKARQQGNSLLLNVSLKNEGPHAVRFLYSFLDVRDDRGRALSAIPDGLPGEVPANGKNFTGTLRIPTALLDNAQKISLTLTDYPEQRLELKLQNIPVTR